MTEKMKSTLAAARQITVDLKTVKPSEAKTLSKDIRKMNAGKGV